MLFRSYYLDEWLEYNNKLGFDKIIMYQNNWTTYIEKPYLEKKILNGPIVQLKAYNLALHEYQNYDWLVFIDCDEFIVLNKHKTIQDFINDFKDKTSIIALNWVLHGSLNKEKRESNSLLKTFNMRNKNVDKHIKVLVKTKSNHKMILPHNCFEPAMDTNQKIFTGPFNFNGPTDIAYISHFRNKTKEDWDLKCKRGRSDCNFSNDINEWEKEKNINNDIEDLSAHNFLYGHN